jgi:hypothetical protein
MQSPVSFRSQSTYHVAHRATLVTRFPTNVDSLSLIVANEQQLPLFATEAESGSARTTPVEYTTAI